MASPITQLVVSSSSGDATIEWKISPWSDDMVDISLMIRRRLYRLVDDEEFSVFSMPSARCSCHALLDLAAKFGDWASSDFSSPAVFTAELLAADYLEGKAFCFELAEPAIHRTPKDHRCLKIRLQEGATSYSTSFDIDPTCVVDFVREVKKLYS